MKLRDKGTLLYVVVREKTFQGKEYLVLKVTYAMEVNQFYHDQSQNNGEYIFG